MTWTSWGAHEVRSAEDRAEQFALEEAEQQQFVAIINWLEALCEHETGVDLMFAPAHIYASSHFIDEQSRQEQWLVLFYDASLFAEEVSPHTEASFGLVQEIAYDDAGDIMTHIVQLTTPEPLTEALEEQMYQRIVGAANAHASGNTGIIPLEQALELSFCAQQKRYDQIGSFRLVVNRAITHKSN